MAGFIATLRDITKGRRPPVSPEKSNELRTVLRNYTGDICNDHLNGLVYGNNLEAARHITLMNYKTSILCILLYRQATMQVNWKLRARKHGCFAEFAILIPLVAYSFFKKGYYKYIA